MIADLVRRAQRGEAEAYTQLVRQFQDAVYATTYQVVLDAETARDLAQETFVRGYQGLGALRRPESFPAWIIRIARNLATDWLRRPERRWLPLEAAPLTETDPAAELATRDLVLRALSTLPAENRLALSLFLVNGYTYQEVARLTGAPLSTVKGRIERAKGKLAREVFAMVEDTLKSGAPDEQFTLETVRESLQQGRAAADAQDLATGRAVAETALETLAAHAARGAEADDLRVEALGLVVQSTHFADRERWCQAKRELVRLAEARGDEAAVTRHLYDLALWDRSLPEDEREQIAQRCLDALRHSGSHEPLVRVLYWRGWHFLIRGEPEQGFALLQEAREALVGVPYNEWHACLEASAEFERLAGEQLDVARRVVWGAGCNILRVEGERIVHPGQPGSSCHSGIPAEAAKFHEPFWGLVEQTDWFPYVGPQPGYVEEQSAFSYTPTPTHMRIWLEASTETISTPAGDFRDCLLMRVTRTESPLDAGVDSPQRRTNRIVCGEKWCWFARGVGPVAYRAERADGIVEHAVLSAFHCPESREEWMPLVVGTRWEYVPAEPGEDFDALMVEWLGHCSADGTWYQPHTQIGNRH
ncbi:sigma-70 family RNA polymerase sigma factor [bacterium]|nr:sigma-70 family RNA polymerase sigma factor [bacterium]